jgi:hypothetical protein
MQNETLSEYEQKAQDFLKATGATVKFKFLKHGKHFPGDKDERDIFQFTIRKDKKYYMAKFGQSTSQSNGHGTKAPTAYDLLASITKHDPGTLEEFCSESGYNYESKQETLIAKQTYKGVCLEYAALQRLFTAEQLELMQEIQ